MKPATVSVVATVSLPAAVRGAVDAPSSDSYSLFSSMLQMMAALALVVGLILLVYYASTRLLGRLPALRPGSRYIRVIEVRALEPRKSLILVEVGGEYLLLASSEGNLSLVKQVAMLEELEIVDELGASVPFSSVLKRFKRVAAETETPSRNA